ESRLHQGRRLCHRPASIPKSIPVWSAMGRSLAAYFRPTVLWRDAMKLPHRRQFLHLVAGAVALPILARSASAQGYPARPVRLIVPAPPGGGYDTVARLTSQWLSERLGTSFVVDNRPGAGGNVGTETVVRAPPDGYTLLLVAAANAIDA